MNKDSKPEPAVETDYSMEEAMEMAAFIEDALSFEEMSRTVTNWK